MAIRRIEADSRAPELLPPNAAFRRARCDVHCDDAIRCRRESARAREIARDILLPRLRRRLLPLRLLGINEDKLF